MEKLYPVMDSNVLLQLFRPYKFNVLKVTHGSVTFNKGLNDPLDNAQIVRTKSVQGYVTEDQFNHLLSFNKSMDEINEAYQKQVKALKEQYKSTLITFVEHNEERGMSITKQLEAK
ncbi:hypothetical protein SHAb15599_00103 [Acinetobacter phage SH-Ab 15599]|nr:hypothetical protein SHAb15599_00103 [Acinetobacter phage SH-Ab 15599]